MQKVERKFTKKQLLFKEIVVGTLIYAVVLGFFNDYTSVVDAQSFSTIFYAAIILQLLTIGAFKIKSMIIGFLKGREGAVCKVAMFFSKFVFV